jgi:flagellar hook-associated protein 3 FlgL
MAEAISELTKQETALQASQATFGRLTNLSLFDYL